MNRMNTITNNEVYLSHRNSCSICGSLNLEIVFDLPELPLTGKFSDKPLKSLPLGIDQNLIICIDCEHVQLKHQVNPTILYDEKYNFRTSKSTTARKGTTFFLSMLDELLPDKKFECVLDLGCNDMYLLKQLKGRAKLRVGIDPILSGDKENDFDGDIQIIGDYIENLDLNVEIESIPDLIVCRHTLEHIYDPKIVLTQLMDFASDDAIFIFEVPGFDTLFQKYRFDQVFHQHLQYFSVHSFKRLIDEIGAHYISHKINVHDWGALLIAFSKSPIKDKINSQKDIYSYNAEIIREKYSSFLEQMSLSQNILKSLGNTPLYGYGAAQMLPVLAYHLKLDFESIIGILDDNIAMDGLFYWNLPLEIMSSSKVKDFENASVLITAVDNALSILNKLSKKSPRHIFYPLQLI